MDQTSAPPPAAVPQQAPDTGGAQQIAANESPAGVAESPAGFRTRGRARRRARFLRKARELAYRDLGGLVFDLHRFGQRNDPLVIAKLNILKQLDGELRALEGSLKERHPVTVLREAGVTACPRCAAIHSGEDHFCPNCGLPMSRHVDLPIAGASSASNANANATVPQAAATPSQPPGGTAPVSPAAPATASIPAAAYPPTRTAPPVSASPAASAPQSAPATARAAAPSPIAPAAPASRITGAPRAPAPSPTPSGEDEPTEIIRPPAADG